MIDNCYTFKELKEKFNWETTLNEISKQITFAKKRGVIIEKAFKKGATHFKIVSIDTERPNEIWKKHPNNDLNIEVSNLGRVRDYDTKKFFGFQQKTTDYQIIRRGQLQFGVHRLVLETFKPIENSHLFYVDHIDGKRNNNCLNNLRWVSAKENILYKHEKWSEISDIFEKLIQKYGYEDAKTKLLTILDE